MFENMTVRAAAPEDVDNIWDILQTYAHDRLLLGRDRQDILEKLKNFKVGVVGDEFICCLALRNYGDSLYEIRSLAVKKEYVNNGIGSLLVKGAVDSLRAGGQIPCRVFALTYRAKFFCRLGFKIVGKELFPQKIWSDCAVCPKSKNCDETAVLMEIR